ELAASIRNRASAAVDILALSLNIAVSSIRPHLCQEVSSPAESGRSSNHVTFNWGMASSSIDRPGLKDAPLCALSRAMTARERVVSKPYTDAGATPGRAIKAPLAASLKAWPRRSTTATDLTRW